MKKYIVTGLNEATQSKKLILLLFAITIIIGLFLAIPFKMSLTSKLGSLPEVYKMLSDYDSTVYNDVMRNYGMLIKAHTTQIMWLAIGSYIMSMIVYGGVFSHFIKQEAYSFRSFVNSCGTYAWRFVKSGLYLLLPMLVIGGIVLVVLGAMLDSPLQNYDSEKPVIMIFLTGMLILLFFWSLIHLIADYARIMIIQNDTDKVLKSVWQATKFVIGKFLSVYSVYLTLILFQFLVFAVYFILESAIGMGSGGAVLIMFLIQQVIVILRVFGKVWLCSSEVELYRGKMSID